MTYSNFKDWADNELSNVFWEDINYYYGISPELLEEIMNEGNLPFESYIHAQITTTFLGKDHYIPNVRFVNANIGEIVFEVNLPPIPRSPRY